MGAFAGARGPPLGGAFAAGPLPAIVILIILPPVGRPWGAGPPEPPLNISTWPCSTSLLKMPLTAACALADGISGFRRAMMVSHQNAASVSRFCHRNGP